MKTYYNLRKGTFIDLTQEVCDLEIWNEKFKDGYSCCRHPNGFYIFLNPEEIMASDEYKDNDPYTVIENLKSDFQQRRLNCTLELIRTSHPLQYSKLLDLGCGQGHITDKIKKEFTDFEVYGLDYSISAIEYASQYFNNIDFLVANAYNPPYPDQYFDIVVCNNIWEHVPDPLYLLKSITRILKPGGRLIISTPSRYRFRNLLRVLLGKKITFMSEHHVTEYTVGQVVEQLRFGGYNVEKAYSPSIKERRIVFRIIKYFLFFLLRTVKSHHILESTVFYSARRLTSGQSMTEKSMN